MYHNIGKYLADNVATLPTLYMQIAWDASVEMQGGRLSSNLIAPGLSGTRPSTSRRINFSELHRLVMGAGLSIPGELANSGLHSLVMGTGYG